jgi:hypothetical protein
MSNEIARFNDFNHFLENMDDTQLDMVQKKIYTMQLQKLDRALAEVTDKVEKLEEARNIDKEMSEKQLELERKRHRVAENRFGYIGLSDLGKQFSVTIGAKTMGQLLRVAGIAKAKQSVTEPYAEMVRQEYAKTVDTTFGANIYKTYQWNSEKCIAKIERWLEKHNLIDQFYSIDNEKELMRFIQELEERYS